MRDPLNVCPVKIVGVDNVACKSLVSKQSNSFPKKVFEEIQLDRRVMIQSIYTLSAEENGGCIGRVYTTFEWK